MSFWAGEHKAAVIQSLDIGAKHRFDILLRIESYALELVNSYYAWLVSLLYKSKYLLKRIDRVLYMTERKTELRVSGYRIDAKFAV